jgi:hypothetical protein
MMVLGFIVVMLLFSMFINWDHSTYKCQELIFCGKRAKHQTDAGFRDESRDFPAAALTHQSCVEEQIARKPYIQEPKKNNL